MQTVSGVKFSAKAKLSVLIKALLIISVGWKMKAIFGAPYFDICKANHC